MSHAVNIARIKTVHTALEDIVSEVVFVGGATVSLYADRPASDSRPTEDVDILIEVAGRLGYASIEEKLRSKGFVNDTNAKVICRYIINEVIVDVMPTDKNILGFANIWYEDAFATAQVITLEDRYEISIMQPPYFIATKLEAFKGRGKGDGRLSSDFEDIVYVLNNRTVIWQEMKQAPVALKEYLQTTFLELIGAPYFVEWVSSHLEFYEQARARYISSNLTAFTSNM